jgi:hypothetical protein
MRAKVVWPDADMADGVERLLSMRPNVATRNWAPGETLIDLMMENAAHGIFDPLGRIPHQPGSTLLQVEEGRIMHDQLPTLRRPQVDA